MVLGHHATSTTQLPAGVLQTENQRRKASKVVLQFLGVIHQSAPQAITKVKFGLRAQVLMNLLIVSKVIANVILIAICGVLANY